MTAPHLLWLLGGVAAILIVATLTGQILRSRIAPDGTNPVIENLNARIAAWWGGGAVVHRFHRRPRCATAPGPSRHWITG